MSHRLEYLASAATSAIAPRQHLDRSSACARSRTPSMTDLTFTYDRVAALRPSADMLLAAAEKLGGVAVWKERAVSFREMADAGILFDDLVRLATEASQLDPDIARRVKLWGADCAAHVLPIFEREMPGDTRPREAIEAARGFARGTVSDAALAAARDATMDATMDATRAAAWAATMDATMDATWDATWAAARAAAWVATRAAASDAEDAEKAWQLDRLCCWMSEQEPQDWPLSEEGRS